VLLKHVAAAEAPALTARTPAATPPAMARTFRSLEPLKGWRKLAIHTWSPPRDPSTYAQVDVPMQAALDYCERARRTAGVRLTVTHLVVKGVALAFKQFPQMNGFVARNRIMIRDGVDIFMQVAAGGGAELSGIKIPNAADRHVLDIARECEERVARLRARQDKQVERTKGMLDRVPRWALGPMMRSISYLIYDWDLDLSRFGVVKDEFGSAMVTNVGLFGITRALAPIVPFSRTTMVVLVGAVEDRVVAERGQAVVQPMMTLGVTYDHRFMDGWHGGEMARICTDYLRDPAALDDVRPADGDAVALAATSSPRS
jgi:pyruvate/2-oxoglutarate dehydrogenase complex dihydrolipoamide acyltransferase (E2) component